MVIIVKACSVCRNSVRDALREHEIPYEEKQVRNATVTTINMMSPSTYEPDSLMAMCWNSLRFPYHQAIRSGDTIACSLVAKS
jgi:hypothetical protein